MIKKFIEKRFTIDKKLLFILTCIISVISICLLILGIIIFTHHKSNEISTIQIVTGPSLFIALVSLIPSIMCATILIWLWLVLFNDGIKNIFKGVIEFYLITLMLYVLVIVLFIMSIIGIIIGFKNWNEIIINV